MEFKFRDSHLVDHVLAKLAVDSKPLKLGFLYDFFGVVLVSLETLFVLDNNDKLAPQIFIDLFMTVARVWRAYGLIVASLIVDIDDLGLNSIVVAVYLYLVVKAHEFLAVNFYVCPRVPMYRVKLCVVSFFKTQFGLCARVSG